MVHPSPFLDFAFGEREEDRSGTQLYRCANSRADRRHRRRDSPRPKLYKNTDIPDDIIRQNACVCCIIIRAHHEDLRYSEKSTLYVEKYD